jgi:hypothetical protein
MKAFLMFPDRDFNLERDLPVNHEAVIQDLGLETVFGAMCRDDALLYDVARQAILSSLEDPEAITYRQAVLADCLGPSRGRSMTWPEKR